MASTTTSHQAAALGPLCRGCKGTIEDKFYLQTDDQLWHGTCLRCQVCDGLLENTSSCYQRNGVIYCEHDYFRLFRQQRHCAHCAREIGRADLVMKALSCVFHVSCFTCAVCGRVLNAGEYFLIDGTKLYCQHELARTSLHSLFAGIQTEHPPDSGPHRPVEQSAFAELKPRTTGPALGFPQSLGARNNIKESRSGAEARAQDYVVMETSKQKRLRTSFKHHQVRVMRTYFSLNHNPDTKDLKTLSEKTGLSKRVLQVWFQNARAKFRRSGLHKSDTNSQTNEELLDSTLSYSEDDASSQGATSKEDPREASDDEEHERHEPA